MSDVSECSTKGAVPRRAGTRQKGDGRLTWCDLAKLADGGLLLDDAEVLHAVHDGRPAGEAGHGVRVGLGSERGWGWVDGWPAPFGRAASVGWREVEGEP